MLLNKENVKVVYNYFSMVVSCMLIVLLSTCKNDDGPFGVRVEANFTADETIIIAGETVSFNDLSLGALTSWEWSFEGGSPATSSSPNPVIKFSTSGEYDVTLTVSDGNSSDTKIVRDFISVSPTSAAVRAQFAVDDSSIDEGESVTFTDRSTGSPTQWLWTFPGGTPATSTEESPTVTYSEAGVYDVTLKVSNENSTNTKSVIGFIRVYGTVTAEFEADNTAVAEGQSVIFTDNSTGSPTQWSWTFQGGTPETSDLQNPAVVYTTTGTFDVTLEASHENSTDTKSATAFIRVFPPVVAEFSNDKTDIVEGDMVTFTDLSTGGATQWQWTFPGGTPSTSTDQNPVVTYNEYGTYSATLTATSPDISGTIEKSDLITVRDPTLVAHYLFNNSLEDASIYENNGDATGGMFTTDRNDNASSAYNFDGDDFIEVPSSASLESVTKEHSIVGWIKIDEWWVNAFGSYAPFVTKSNSAAFPSSLHFTFLPVIDGVGSRPCNGVGTESLLTLDQWQFIALIYDGATISYYRNNVKIASIDCTDDLNVNSLPLILGRDVPGEDEFLMGSIDDIRIYNRALTESELTALYNE